MLMSDERAVRRALAFGESLHHENLTKIMGTWEAEDALYIVEEYASKGDVQQDSMSHPERYTEAYMAVHVVKPLLNVLVYLHGQRILHRALYPENIMFGRDDKLRIGHYTSLVDLKLDSPTDRCDFLDYMAPEMLAMKDDEERMKALVSPTGEGVGGGGPAAGRARRRRTAAQNAATGDVQDAMMRLATGDDNAASGLLSMPTSQSLAASPAVLQRGATGNMQGDGNDEVDKSLFRRITKSFTTLLGRNDADDDDGKPAERTLSVMSTSLLSPRGGAGSIKVDSSRPNTVTSPEPVGRPSNPGGPGGGGVLGMLGRKLAGATVVPADRTIIVPHNPWEWQDSYDEKVDIWQVGCLVHEVMCGVLPFETEDKLLAAALILWADIQVFPDNLSPQCVSFIQACLTKDPRQRPSAESLLQHEWITRHEAGETLLTQAEIAAQNPNAGKTNADGSAVKRGGLLGVWDSVSSVLPAWMGGRPSAVAPGVGPTQPTAMSAKAYQRRGVSAAAGHLADNAYVGGAPAATSAVPPVARLEGASGALDAQGLVQREASVASAGDRALAGAARFPSRKKAVEEIQAEQQNRGEAKPNWQMLF
uniref:Protein kinase domain-containing protein n=1 Tax=Chlamydomonas leiostraca TaxID=1034604 RepID=A0A7S0WKQ3_9CHLO